MSIDRPNAEIPDSEHLCDNDTRKWWKSVMFRRFVYGAVFLFLVLVIGAYVIYHQLQPKQHFNVNHIPIVAEPAALDSAKASGVSNTRTASLMQAGVFNVLLLGVDARSPNDPARTDSIILIHVNLPRHDYEMMSIPRDTRVQLAEYGYTKITHANYMGELNGGLSDGTRDTIQAVSNLTGMDINYYAETNYWGLQDIVDSLGGVTVQVPFPVKLTHAWYPRNNGKTIPAGMQSLNGQMATELVHERYSLSSGEFGRQQLQKDVLLAIAKKLTKPSSVPDVERFLHALPKYLVTTNLTSSDFISMILGVKGFNENQVHYYQVPGYSAYLPDPIVGTQLYFWIPDRKTLDKVLKNHFMD